MEGEGEAPATAGDFSGGACGMAEGVGAPEAASAGRRSASGTPSPTAASPSSTMGTDEVRFGALLIYMSMVDEVFTRQLLLYWSP